MRIRSITVVLVVGCLAGDLPAMPTCGDCDELLNGITILDALEAARIGLALDSPAGTQGCTCDLDGNAAINIIDALLIAQIAVGQPTVIVCGAACQGSCAGTLALRGPASPVRCGTQTTVFVDADLGFCPLGAYQLRASWDPSVLQLDPTFGIAGVLMTPAGSPAVIDDSTPGLVIFNGIFGCPSVFLSTIASLRFDVIGTPSSSSLVRLDVDDLVRCDTSTIGPPNPRFASQIAVNVSSQACYVPCAASGSVNLSGPTSADCGSTFLVPVNVDLGTCDLGAYEFEVTWDPSVFTLDTTFGTQGVLMTPAGAPSVVNPSTPGFVIFNGVFSCPAPGFSALATLRLEATGSSGSSSALDVIVRDLVRCDTSRIGPANPRMGSGINISIGGPGCAPPPITVTPVSCGATRMGSFATGLPVVDVADDATTDYFVLSSISAGTTSVTFSTTGTGDIDLYVGNPGVAGGTQTVASYPASLRSLSVTSTEQVVLSAASTPALSSYGSGPVAIAVHAYAAGSYSLNVSCASSPPPGATQLSCGIEATGGLPTDGNGNLAASGATDFFFIDAGGLPAGLTELVIITGGTAGDMDLYVGNPGTPAGSTSAGGYIQLTGDGSHHSYVMPAAEVAGYGSGDIAIAVHANRQGDYRVVAACLTPSSAYRYVRQYVYTVGATMSSSISNSNPTGRDRFNKMLEEWSRVNRQSPSPEFHAAFEVRQWSDSSANPYRNLDFDTEDTALASYTAMFPTNPNRPPGPHTFFVETLTAGGGASLGISYLDRSGEPGSFGAGNVVSLDTSTFATTSCADYTYVLGLAAAHECGHYMSLEHTTQFSGACGGAVAYYDTFSDTPQCLPGTGCGMCPDFFFLMYPVIFDLGCPLSIANRQDDVSPMQEGAMEANPCPR